MRVGREPASQKLTSTVSAFSYSPWGPKELDMTERLTQKHHKYRDFCGLIIILVSLLCFSLRLGVPQSQTFLQRSFQESRSWHWGGNSILGYKVLIFCGLSINVPQSGFARQPRSFPFEHPSSFHTVQETCVILESNS